MTLISAIGLAAAPQRVVKVAVFPNVPAIFMDKQGEPYGFYVDMLREVAAKEGWDLRFVPGTWQESLDRVQSGEVDLLTCVAYTPERDRYLDYGQEPSFTVWSILYTHPGSGITNVLDTRNRRIALMRGDINGEHFRELCTQFNLSAVFSEYNGFSDVLQAVADGHADGGVTSNIYGYSQESLYGVERTPVVFSPFDHHFATREGQNGDLLAALDAYLRDGRNRPDSGYHRAINRWLSPQSKVGLPPWAWRTGLAILAALALSIAVAFTFRRKVGKATAEIRDLNRGLERELAERKRVAEQILHMVNGLSAATGESFLHELVKHLAQATEADVAFIGECLSAGDAGRIRTLSVFSRGVPGENFEYAQAGTPCERALRGEVCVFAAHVQESFPTCGMLRDQNADSYIGAPLVDSQGRTLGVLAVLHRASPASPAEVAALLRIFSTRAAAELERRNAEEARLLLERQMQHAQKLESLGVLAGGIAHDFNNLLTAMLGHMNVAQLKLAPESPAMPHLDSLEQIIHRAADLTRQMLAYSGKGRFVVRPYDLNHVVQEVTHLLEVSIPKKIALRFQLAPVLPLVEADAAQIQQVIMNLVTNAADAIGETEGTIRLSTGSLEVDRAYLDQVFQGQDLAPGAYVTLEVSDSGCGMTPEIQARIFEPFFTTKLSGRGLGLSATVGILRGHHAGLRIYSEAGHGTTFKLLFPASEVLGEAAPAPAAAPAPSGRVTVLLVDDEEMIREAAAAALESLGLTVITAGNGFEALDVLHHRGGEVDVVLMDLTMPHMDGREAFQEIRRILPQLPVILSSGYSEQESLQDFMGRGLTAFLQKPYTLRTLEQTVLGAVGKGPKDM
ncbi:response regulator [Geothrix campi]|uniref:response regulator n=1 Tax=Geothrix campi TaxID=2966450 RepID=UPI002147ADCF|nr:transporter substrate-binding domain-containing protein [Geothrix sp. SG10]